MLVARVIDQHDPAGRLPPRFGLVPMTLAHEMATPDHVQVNS